jgi:hypothetical protein
MIRAICSGQPSQNGIVAVSLGIEGAAVSTPEQTMQLKRHELLSLSTTPLDIVYQLKEYQVQGWHMRSID